jgi:hypothetical protein
MVRVAIQNPLITVLCLVILLNVFVQYAQVQEGAYVRGKTIGGPSVQAERLLVIPMAVVLQSQSE